MSLWFEVDQLVKTWLFNMIANNILTEVCVLYHCLNI